MPALYEQMDSLLVSNLRANGIPLVSTTEAKEQDMPFSAVVLANMMPAKVMQATEVQWGEQYCTEPSAAVAVKLAKFDNDCREALHPETGEPRSRANNLKRYTPISDIRTNHPDLPIGVLILTGDNEEIEPLTKGLSVQKRVPKPVDQLDYGEQLHSVVEWGELNAPITLVSCLASHFVLNYFHDLPKQTLDNKVFGVFEHTITDDKDPLVRGMGRSIIAPHSRWGDVSIKQIEDRNNKVKEARRLKILAASPDIGWLMLKETLPNGHIRVYLQGHPEYDRDDLKNEWKRDVKRGIDLPVNYFPDDVPENTPRETWAPGAYALNHNILRESGNIAAASQVS